MNPRLRALLPLILVAVSAGVYLQTIGYGFVADDPRQIEVAHSRFTWSQIPHYFTEDVWSYVERDKSNYYRPVFLVWLMLNYQTFGLETAGWHATTVAMHAAATLLLFFLARKLSGDDTMAFAAAVLFAVHPIHVEGVAWVSGVTEPLFAALTLGSILCFVEARREASRARWWQAWSVALFALDMFAKETAIVVPAILAAAVWIFDKDVRSWRPRAIAAVRAVVPYAGVAAVYVTARILVLGAFAVKIGKWPAGAVWRTTPEAAWFYFTRLVWPAGMRTFYDIAPVRQIDFSNFVLPLAGCLATGALLALLWRMDRVAAFFVVVLVVPMLPVLTIRNFSPEDFVHDRYLYLPSAGLCVLAAMLIRRFEMPQLQIVCVALLTAAGAWGTVRESGPWRDRQTLAQRDLELSPGSIRAKETFAGVLVINERFVDALPLLTEAMAVHPEEDGLFEARGICYLKLGEFDRAVADLQRFTEMVPNNPHGLLLLGMAEAGLGQTTKAERDMRQSLRLRPRASSAQYQGYHATLADLLERKGDLQGALGEYEAESNEYPDDQNALDQVERLRRSLRAK
ncbi:MAG: tetratricopeptide repeat protein [Acidobacteriia bacterium]|nr:tetratricopeptide repeat protein [Terriglobia bacterium]